MIERVPSGHAGVMVAHSASVVRPLLPPQDDSTRANVSDALARLATIAPKRPSARLEDRTASLAKSTDGPAVPPQSTVQLTRGKRSSKAVDDASLVLSTLAGDPRGSASIWARYSPLVRSKLSRSVGGLDVDDQVQEVFLRLFLYLDQLRDPSALRSFIIGITLRVAGTELRRRRCRSWLTLTTTGDLPEPAVFDDVDGRRIVRRLFGILDRLAPESARVFELRYIDEKELSEVAAAMKVSLATAKRYLARVSARVHAMAEREPILAGYAAGARR